ncbi:uncharacterized protein LOC120079198 [Benincasa hispida]|uniref:uncharacterized protein LOC120079198 n=1 Tax=Benincasa hispida TaxID=102211 RepID=UPI001902BF56|nr:uncharacterized protein LOC120079198 [Benincasa hispida]
MDIQASSNFSSISPPVFNGDNYQVWAVHMMAYMEALDIWEAMEKDYEIPDLLNNPTMAQIKLQKEKKIRKSKAKACLFVAVSSTIFTRIMTLKLAYGIWNYLKLEFEGDARTKGMHDSRIVEKILVTVPKKFEASISALENTKDLTQITLAEILNALQAQKQRRAMKLEGVVEGALQAKPENARNNKKNQNLNGKSSANNKKWVLSSMPTLQ